MSKNEAAAPRDGLLDRILYDCRPYDCQVSGGTMPLEIVVADEAAKARGLVLLKGRHHNGKISFVTEAELTARIGRRFGEPG